MATETTTFPAAIEKLHKKMIDNKNQLIIHRSKLNELNQSLEDKGILERLGMTAIGIAGLSPKIVQEIAALQATINTDRERIEDSTRSLNWELGRFPAVHTLYQASYAPALVEYLGRDQNNMIGLSVGVAINGTRHYVTLNYPDYEVYNRGEGGIPFPQLELHEDTKTVLIPYDKTLRVKLYKNAHYINAPNQLSLLCYRI